MEQWTEVVVDLRPVAEDETAQVFVDIRRLRRNARRNAQAEVHLVRIMAV